VPAVQVDWPGPGQPEYLFKMPTTIPEGRILAHNNERPARNLGEGGFRAWLAEPDAPRLIRCDCGWAPDLGAHYTVPRS